MILGLCACLLWTTVFETIRSELKINMTLLPAASEVKERVVYLFPLPKLSLVKLTVLSCLSHLFIMCCFSVDVFVSEMNSFS